MFSIILGILSTLVLAMTVPPSWSEEQDPGDGAEEILRRVKRGWVWNQFFVLEEYTGLEPLYIGKVRCHAGSAGHPIIMGLP